MPQTEMWSIIVSIMVTLFVIAVILGIRLGAVSQRLKIVDNEIDLLMQKLNLPKEALLKFRDINVASEKHEIAFKQLNSQVDSLMNKDAEHHRPDYD
jgi:hypothetical protein